MKYSIFALAALFAISVSAGAGDPVAGRKVYLSRCQSCHAVDKGGSNKLGPLLFGIIGKKAGTLPGYAYSRPLKSSKFVLDRRCLARMACDSQIKLAGTRMALPVFPTPSRSKTSSPICTP